MNTNDNRPSVCLAAQLNGVCRIEPVVGSATSSPSMAVIKEQRLTFSDYGQDITGLRPIATQSGRPRPRLRLNDWTRYGLPSWKHVRRCAVGICAQRKDRPLSQLYLG